MAKLIGHIGAPHGPYRFSDVRCARKGFLSIFTYRVNSVSHPLEMMERGHAVVVLPVDFSKGTVILIRQPRFNLGFLASLDARAMQERALGVSGGVRGVLRRAGAFIAAALALHERKPRAVPVHADVPPEAVLTYEMPAGVIDPGETALNAAIRELREETGISVDMKRVSMVAKYHPSIGGSTEQLTAYIADISGCIPDLTNAGEGDESIDVMEFTVREAFAMLAGGALRSASANILLRELRIRILERGFAP